MLSRSWPFVSDRDLDPHNDIKSTVPATPVRGLADGTDEVVPSSVSYERKRLFERALFDVEDLPRRKHAKTASDNSHSKTLLSCVTCTLTCSL